MTETMSIGSAAAAAGVTTRTLRYYEQLRLLPPTARSVGGARRYTEADLERVARIRRLQDLLGHDLEQIRRVIGAEDRMAELRQEWQADAPLARREEILAEAMEINAALRAEVNARLTALHDFASELDDKARLHRKVAKELRAERAALEPTTVG